MDVVKRKIMNIRDGFGLTVFLFDPIGNNMNVLDDKTMCSSKKLQKDNIFHLKSL